MKKRVALPICILCLAGAAAWGQDRHSIPIYIPEVQGGTPQQAEYFQNAFKEELIGANYPEADTQANAVYTLRLTVFNNPDFDESAPLSDDNTRYELGVTLLRNEDDSEVVSFSFGFNDPVENMNRWNLYLLYQALANAYIPPDTVTHQYDGPAVDDRWRNKTFYVNLAAGLDSGHFLQTKGGHVAEGILMPLALAGVEWHFLDFLSLEVDPVKPRFLYNGSEVTVTLSFPALVKGVFKPGGVMLEPYAGAEYALAIIGGDVPPLSALAGVQLGFRAGPRSAWTLDVGGSMSVVGSFKTVTGNSYDLLRLHIMAGWKVGFRDRPQKPAPAGQTPAADGQTPAANGQTPAAN